MCTIKFFSTDSLSLIRDSWVRLNGNSTEWGTWKKQVKEWMCDRLLALGIHSIWVLQAPWLRRGSHTQDSNIRSEELISHEHFPLNSNNNHYWLNCFTERSSTQYKNVRPVFDWVLLIHLSLSLIWNTFQNQNMPTLYPRYPCNDVYIIFYL